MCWRPLRHLKRLHTITSSRPDAADLWTRVSLSVWGTSPAQVPTLTPCLLNEPQRDFSDRCWLALVLETPCDISSHLEGKKLIGWFWLWDIWSLGEIKPHKVSLMWLIMSCCRCPTMMSLQSWSRLITDRELDQYFSCTCEGGRFPEGQLFPEVCQIPLGNECAAGGRDVFDTQAFSPECSHTPSIITSAACVPEKWSKSLKGKLWKDIVFTWKKNVSLSFYIFISEIQKEQNLIPLKETYPAACLVESSFISARLWIFRSYCSV